MVDLEGLARRARRAAEWGRLKSASRIAVAVVPAVLVAMLLSPHRAAVVGVGMVLFATCVLFGWLGAESGRAARFGLTLGAIPMTVGLFTIAVEGWCEPTRDLTACGLGCLLAGLLAGGASAWYALRSQSPHRFRVWSEIGIVASLTTALGCVGLGIGSALAVLAAMAAGAAAAWLPARARSA